MREVSVFEAKNKLSALVTDAAAGQTIAITRRGVVVAHLTPPGGPPTDEPSRTLKQLIAQRNALARAHPEMAKPIPWEELRDEMDADLMRGVT
jgi:antitoxin (DNA-binding transcriptional repressor) of toxin-antitoxin stability system